MEKVEGTPDSYVIRDFFSKEFADSLGERLENELNFELVKRPSKGKPKAIFQSEVIDGKLSYLRCPSIDPKLLTGFTPTISEVVRLFNANVGTQCNIAKILKYEGSNKLKNHADKIIDLKENSNIHTLRFGAERPLLLISKLTGKEIRLMLPHNSLFILGWYTNREWTHGIPSHSTGTTYSIVLRTSISLLNSEELSVSSERSVSSHFLLDKEKEVVLHHLWATENKKPVDISHYASLC